MDKETILSDIDRVYEGIQHLQLQPTKGNTAIVLDTIQVLEEIYSFLKDSPDKNETDQF